MREIPILFSTPMVQAILAGRKTQTRRQIKPRSYITDIVDGIPYEMTEDDSQPIKCPYGEVGDVLWVRETFKKGDSLLLDDKDVRFYIFRDGSQLFTSGEYVQQNESLQEKGWKPSIHMPKEAARIWLRITNIRVERLHDISNDDIQREGAADFGCTTHFLNWQTLWQSINGEQSWDNNPWVWVVEFERIVK